MDEKHLEKIKNHLHNDICALSKWDFLTTIKKGEKPYYTQENEIKILEVSYFQSIYRWYNNQNRNSFFTRFRDDFREYIKFRENYLSLKLKLYENVLYFPIFTNEINLIDDKHYKILNGLNVLKTTYNNDNNIKNIITEIINELNKPFSKSR